MTTHIAIELTRGNRVESRHLGHAVVVDSTGDIIAEWGDPAKIIYPRSSAKMIQALPLIESGAADRYNLSHRQLALACASHQGAAIHTDPVKRWLHDLGLSDADLRCGPQVPNDVEARDTLIKSDSSPCQYHNNCSGKHTGFLTLNQYLGGNPEYLEPDHPVQRAVLQRFDEVTRETSQGFGIDGCSAPNPAVTLAGFATALAWFANAHTESPAGRLRTAMMIHPELVAGETRACTELMRAMPKKAALKTGAEGVFAAILPEQGLGIALKIEDGTTRASEAAITALLTRFAGLDASHPAARKRNGADIENWRKIKTGSIAAHLSDERSPSGFF